MKKLLLYIVPVCLTAHVFAQSQRQTKYASGHEDFISSLQITGDKNLLAGHTLFGTDSARISFITLNDSDEVLGVKSFRSSRAFCLAEHMIAGSDGYILGGKTSDSSALNPFLMKVDTGLNVQWSKRFDNLSFWHGRILRIIPNGTGYTLYTHAEVLAGDLYRIEGNAGGSSFPSTQYTFGSSVLARMYDAEPMKNSSSHILCGAGNYAGSQTRGGILMKTTPAQGEWCRFITAGGNFKNDIVDVITLTDGSSLCLFVCENIPGNQYSSLVIKTDSTGNLVWAKQLGLSNVTLNGSGLVETNSGEILVATYDNLLNAYLTRLDANGALLSTRKWDPPGAPGAKYMKFFKDLAGNIVLSGQHDSSYFVARLDVNGNGCSFVNSSAVSAISVTPTLVNVPLTSAPTSVTTQAETMALTTISLSESILCGATGIESQESANSVRVYPNPASGYIEVDLSETHLRNYSISVRNALGKDMLTNIRTPRIDTSRLPAGIYFIEVTGNDRTLHATFTRE